MRVEVLRWFIALAEREHLSDAALELHMSQSTLSRAITGLEDEVGMPLFDRRGRRLELNANGRRYIQAARQAVGELDTAERELRQRWSADQGVVRLAFLHSLGEWLVPALVGAFRRTLPDISFQLAQDAMTRMAAAVLEGHADLGVVGPRPRAPVGWFELVREPIRLVVPAGHPLVDRTRVGLHEIADETYVLLKPPYGLRMVLDELFGSAGIEPRIAFEGEDIGTLIGLVSAGLGVTLAPPPASSAEGVRLIPLRDAGAHRALGVIWDPSRPASPAVAAFLGFVRSDGRSVARHAVRALG